MTIYDSSAHSEDEPICEVVITAPDSEWLADLTRKLVERRLVAGSHQIETVRSIYRWKSEIHDVHEARVTLRTRLTLFDEIAETARAFHPYVTPSIVAVPLVASTDEYRRWVLEETR
jgi:periplasmic divalent cation tolerance protein